MGRLLFALMLLLAVAFMSDSADALSCSVKPSCSANETAVLKLSAATNAHAGTVADAPSYPYTVCCKDAETNLSRSCTANGDIFLRLGSSSNAHVQAKYLSEYSTDACMTGTGGEIDCEYAFPPNPVGSCSFVGAEYACVATMFNYTNAHLGNCSAYNTTVCCRFSMTAETPPLLILDHPTSFNVPLGAQGRLVVKVKNALKTPDIVEVSLVGNPQKLHNWIWFEGHRYDDKKYSITIELKPREERAVAINIFGGEVNSGWPDSSIIRVIATSTSSGLQTELSETVGIQYSNNGVAVQTPEFGWLGFVLIALFGAIFSLGSGKKLLSII